MLLEIEDLQASYGASQVLFGVTLGIDRGEVVTLIGRNGMGKTTTINSMLGMLPARGKIQFAGKNIQHLPSHRRARCGIGLVPEGRQIFSKLSVKENLLVTARNDKRGGGPWTLASVYELFPRLKERESQAGNTLSGGEQQMLAIGRALMTNPSIVILDEATEGLAPLIRAEIWSCLGKLKQSGQSMLVVDKNLSELSHIADRHYVLDKGRVAWTGSNDDLARDHAIVDRHLTV